MRDNPDGNIIRRLLTTKPITVDGRHPNNAWVRVITADGARGWVALDYVVLTGAQFDSLPVVEGGASAACGPAPSTEGTGGI